MESNVSVYELIKSLCKCLVSENVNFQNDDKILKKCKFRAYEVLLKKSSNAIDNCKTVDPTVENIDFQQFSMRIQCKNKIDHLRCDDFDKVIEELYRSGIVDDEVGHKIISLLILLKDCVGPVCIHQNIFFFCLNILTIFRFTRFLNHTIIKNTLFHNMEPYQKHHEYFVILFELIIHWKIIHTSINQTKIIHLLK